jgi:hypothetical protein
VLEVLGRGTLKYNENVYFALEGTEYLRTCLKFQRGWGCGGNHDRLMQVPNERLELLLLGCFVTKQPQPNPNMNSVPKKMKDTYLFELLTHKKHTSDT